MLLVDVFGAKAAADAMREARISFIVSLLVSLRVDCGCKWIYEPHRVKVWVQEPLMLLATS